MFRLALPPTQTPTEWVQGFFPGVKCFGCKVNHSPPSSAEVKDEWSYTMPLFSWHGQGNVTIFYIKKPGYTNPGLQIAMVNKFCTVEPNICGS